MKTKRCQKHDWDLVGATLWVCRVCRKPMSSSERASAAYQERQKRAKEQS